MNFLILGDGTEERAWAKTLADEERHLLLAATPGGESFPSDLQRVADLDAALALADVDAAVVGGSVESREETLRRAAGAGLAVICLHPPGTNADPYYQVALSREETGAVVVPDLPGRLHPGLIAIRDAATDGSLGTFRGLRIEAPGDPDLAGRAFPVWVDLARAIVGEIGSLNALGDPPGPDPTHALTVQLRSASGRLAELRLSPYRSGTTANVTLTTDEGSLRLEVAPDFEGPSRLIRIDVHGTTTATELPEFDRNTAILDVLTHTVAGQAVHPDLIDGTRAMELTSAMARSLRRGRSVDLHYEEVTETNNFKTVMTSVGCLILLMILVALPLALVGPALGIGETIYIAYAIPPILVLFAILQFLRFAMKPNPVRTSGND